MSSHISCSLICEFLLFPFIYLSYICYFLMIKMKQHMNKCSPTLQLPNKKEKTVEALTNSKQEILLISGITTSNIDDNHSQIFLKYSLSGKKSAISLTLKLFNQKRHEEEQFHLCCKSSKNQSASFQRNTLKLGHCWLEMREPFRRWRLRVQGTARNSQGEEKEIRIQAWWLCSSDPSFVYDNLSIFQLTKIAKKMGKISLDQKLKNCCEFIQFGVLRCRFEVIGEKSSTQLFDFHGPRIRLAIGGGHTSLSTIALERLTFKHFFESTERHVNYELFASPSYTTIALKEIFRSDQSIEVFIETGGENKDLDHSAELLFEEDDDDDGGSGCRLSVHSKLLYIQTKDEISDAKMEKCYLLELQVREGLLKEPYETDEQEEVNLEKDKELLICRLEEKACENPLTTGGKASNLTKIIRVQSSDPHSAPNFQVPKGVVLTTTAYQQFMSRHPHLQQLIGSLCASAKYGCVCASQLQAPEALVRGLESYRCAHRLTCEMNPSYDRVESTVRVIRARYWKNKWLYLPRPPPPRFYTAGCIFDEDSQDQFADCTALFLNPSSFSSERRILRELSDSITQAFSKISNIGDSLLEAEILKEVRSISSSSNILFAVRSSAVGEDSSELSSAGQLETFLNVLPHQVILQVINCWASNFRWEIVNYRLENCLALDPAMAVIVQQMVTGGVAGVMFTADPVRGEYSKAVLNMVQGDGEALVGGQVTPSQLVVDKSTMQIVDAKESCLPLELERCLELVEIGVFLQLKVFDGVPQDVEFVATDQDTYIVQSRAITSMDLESEWELQHEFDTALWSPNDVLTTANVGEVLPNIQCPLHISVVSFSLSSKIHEMVQLGRMFGGAVNFRHYSCSSVIYRQRTFLNLTEIYLSDWETLESNHIGEYSLAGRRLYTKQMFDVAKARFSPKSQFHKICGLVNVLKLLFFDSKSLLKRGEDLINKYDSVEKLTDQLQKPSNIFQFIVQLCHIMDEIIYVHTAESTFSSATYTFVAMLLRGSAEGDLTPDLLSDIATIYSNNPLKVVSADLPESLKKLAVSIKDAGHQNKFMRIEDPKTAMDWLLSVQDKTGEMCRNFFQKHGHRGLDELEFLGSTWDSNPAMLQKTLKALLNNMSKADAADQDANTPKKGSLEDVFKQLKTKLTPGQRFGLKMLIAHAHRGVWSREESKNYFVKVVHKLRHAFQLLAIALQKQRLLPDPQLIFFLTLQEIEELIGLKDASTLVSRSRRRRRILEAQAIQKYSLLNYGVPNASESIIFENTTTSSLTGTCVCEGIVQGKARVASSLKEAEITEPGEILITKYTDIGWSPLFPIIRGLVTEIGGLLSHGAVVAREQGLPCLIAVQNATDFFQTGDEVLLNATHGTIGLIKKEKEP